MNFADEAVRYWELADQHEQEATYLGNQLKAAHGVIIDDPARSEALGMQRHYLRKAHAAAALALVYEHKPSAWVASAINARGGNL